MSAFEPRDHVWVFSAHIDRSGNRPRVVANGRIGARSAPEFEQALLGAAAEGHEVELDLAGVDYISSAGVYALERAAGRAAVVITQASEPARVTLRLAGAMQNVTWREGTGK